MAAIGVPSIRPLAVWMNRWKSPRRSQPAWLIRSSTAASGQCRPWAWARRAAARSAASVMTGPCRGDDAAGEVGQVGHAEVDGGAAGGELVELGEFLLGGGEADGEPVGFAEPALAAGFVDA